MNKFKNATATPVEVPQEQTIINHAPSYAGLVFSILLAVLIAVPTGAWWLWSTLVYILQEAGFRDGEKTLASGLILLTIGMVVVGLLALFFRIAFDRWAAFRLELAETEIARLRVMHQLQAATIDDSRSLDKDTRRRDALITALVVDAINGRVNMSYRKAGAYVLIGEQDPVGKDSGVVIEALNWLRGVGAVDGNKWTGRFTLSQIQRKLHNPPVIGAGKDSSDRTG